MGFRSPRDPRTLGEGGGGHSIRARRAQRVETIERINASRSLDGLTAVRQTPSVHTLIFSPFCAKRKLICLFPTFALIEQLVLTAAVAVLTNDN